MHCSSSARLASKSAAVILCISEFACMIMKHWRLRFPKGSYSSPCHVVSTSNKISPSPHICCEPSFGQKTNRTMLFPWTANRCNGLTWNPLPPDGYFTQINLELVEFLTRGNVRKKACAREGRNSQERCRGGPFLPVFSISLERKSRLELSAAKQGSWRCSWWPKEGLTHLGTEGKRGGRWWRWR